MENYTVNEGKTNAIISYFTIIGTIIALILNNDKKNSFASFHIRQMVGLNALYFLSGWFVMTYISFFIGVIINIILFVFWIIGLIGALKGEEKKIPLLGDQFQEWFKNI
ncbi:DUF4870 domain-containing protein [Tenacibaculum finnmarkense]|uniref:DUF4870 domain-containing protein n=1 Tax=Tenacibaculum TaxID=104267 RepID=UPI000C479F77|nr:hypothetical protein [Tenacibaculum finnmarkense]MBE7660936.1 hypothetical protein [Tenacibaculum finnmarkense genomovar finnmarkense]MCD8412036.1 hypothetical protein [Tenacibaculum finnmarkense genomovar ulcerans]MCD8439676.1 hypothetical protein [Tenacibaculum finnmarkense genomovar ulcerans]MCG8206939.1 hypothetical protein [Tenacibaculum finnmarkense genomovar finnmarkense]MCG8252604.1 hypothetical protein [Tenacibaculum finnmarkense genomovar finnmarkense]